MMSFYASSYCSYIANPRLKGCFSIRQSLHSDRSPLRSLKQVYPPQAAPTYMARRTEKGLTSKNGYVTDNPRGDDHEEDE